MSAPLVRFLRQTKAAHLLDNPRLRQLLGAPLYPRHRAALAARDAAAWRRRRKTLPTLSVIVPCYNVANYLDECLTSIITQSYPALEIILINDGSTDGTVGKLAEWQRQHPELIIITTENRGLSAARNAGVARATGELLTFVDSDDTLPPLAYDRLVGSLVHHPADVAVGGVDRFTSTRRWQPESLAQIHREDRFGVTGLEFPEVMGDIFAWNKVYRASVWREVVGRFPEGFNYEDQEGTAALYVNPAVRLNILHAVTYSWRRRDDASSITQNKGDVTDLRHRLRSAREVARIYAAAPEWFQRQWRQKLLIEDLYWYALAVPGAGEEFWEILHEFAREFSLEEVTAAEGFPPERQAVATCLVAGTREKLLALLAAESGE